MRTLRKGLTSKFAGALLRRTWWAGSPMGTAATPGRAGVGEMPWGLRAVAVQDKNPERPGNLSRRLSLMSVKGVKSGTQNL
jgi:hypothetical protein